MIPHKQLSLADVFEVYQNNFENDKPALLSLLENHIDLDEIVPVSFYNHFMPVQDVPESISCCPDNPNLPMKPAL